MPGPPWKTDAAAHAVLTACLLACALALQDLEKFLETGVHPDFERNQGQAAVTSLPEQSTTRPYVFMEFAVDKQTVGAEQCCSPSLLALRRRNTPSGGGGARGAQAASKPRPPAAAPAGRVAIELFEDVAPIAVALFQSRCVDGASDTFAGTRVHQILPQMAVRGGLNPRSVEASFSFIFQERQALVGIAPAGIRALL